jgi:exosome complex RNA-binding protein Rrp42 (RNase PH superfamily)
MQFKIQDPEETERKLLDAGFRVGVNEDRFVVYLQSRKVTRSEVAEVLACETEGLALANVGVLVG